MHKGSALFVVIAVSTILLFAVLSASVVSVADMNLTIEEKLKTKLELACESGLSRAKSKIQESFNHDDLVKLFPEVLFEGTDIDDTGLTPDEKAYDDEAYALESGTVYSYSFDITPEDGDVITVKYSIKNLGDWSLSSEFVSYPLEIEAIAYIPNKGWIGMTENVTIRRTALFMYQVFFEDDLEILPGPTFNLRGLIHTNSNLYLNAGNTMNIYTDSISAAKEIFRERLDKDASGGTVNISSEDQDGSMVKMYKSDYSTRESNPTDWINTVSDKWKGTVKDKHLGASRIEAPKLQSFEPGGFYDQQAQDDGLKIDVLAEGNSLEETLYKITCNGTEYAAKLGSEYSDIFQDVEIYDGREKRNQRLTQIDVNKLDQVCTPNNGLIYMTRNDNTVGSSEAGFKLSNGSELPYPVSFITDQPAYIEGNFNLHTDEDPEIDKWKPTALISDSVNILSNSWKDKTTSSMTTASDTTVNTVFITGNTETTSGSYNGGLENFPRLLENWSGKKLNITGGFMQLFRSKYAIGKWSYGSYYKAPQRNWSSEDRFESLMDLPPGYSDLFPSINASIIYSKWQKINKSEAEISES